jgi:hypothetical protein
MTIRFSLREHDRVSGAAPNFVFSKPDATTLRIYSNNASRGRGYAFYPVSRTWLNGKYLRFSWSGTVGPTTSVKVVIYDGKYDRSSDTDFPEHADFVTKGTGLLQTLITKTANFATETQDILINLAAGIEDLCTIFFFVDDTNVDNAITVNIDWVEINSASGGSGNLQNEHFTDSITMERSDTENDYGYIS